MMTVGSLFSGIGGFDLGLERAGMRIEWQVENNEFCRQVLKKHWPKVPCHCDITQIDWRFIPRVDLVCGGFPCQPFSVAGKRAGKADDRYLWPEVVRCLDTLRPTWFLGENVPGIINLALDQVCTDLESLGYAVWPVCVPACAVDAPHQRQRVWILAYSGRKRRQQIATSSHGHESTNEGRTSKDVHELASDGEGHRARHVADALRLWELQSQGIEQDERGWASSGGEDVAHAETSVGGRSDAAQHTGRRDKEVGRCGVDCGGLQHWLPEPNVGRVAHGVPGRVDRLRGLGNAVVPQVADALGRMIMEAQP